MLLSEFKSQFGISAINLYQSKSSSRLIGSFFHNQKKNTIVTTETFNGQQPVFVVPTEVPDPETGEVSTIYVLTNKSATPKLTL